MFVERCCGMLCYIGSSDPVLPTRAAAAVEGDAYTFYSSLIIFSPSSKIRAFASAIVRSKHFEVRY